MYELSLFTGAGGGLLGTHLLGWTPVGYVEWNDYCQRIIAARIADGILPNAPIFGNIKTFIGSGYAASYTGLVDVVTGGFPCQPFSVAGKRAGADDERNMWPETINTIRIVRPKYCLLENVPGIISSGYFGAILGDLAESGFDVRWRVLSAAELGAPHKRDRLWIVANATGEGGGRLPIQQGRSQQKSAYANGSGQDVANATGKRCHGGILPPPGECPAGRASVEGNHPWAIEPDVGRISNGVAFRVDRLTAIGNGQVPAVARTAWELLT